MNIQFLYQQIPVLSHLQNFRPEYVQIPKQGVIIEEVDLESPYKIEPLNTKDTDCCIPVPPAIVKESSSSVIDVNALDDVD